MYDIVNSVVLITVRILNEIKRASRNHLRISTLIKIVMLMLEDQLCNISP